MFKPLPSRAPYTAMPVRPDLGNGFDYSRHLPSATFDSGGRVKVMRELAEMLRNQGEGEDKILAHINIDEARLLGKKQGYSGRNPITGLPQFGKKKNLLRRIARVVAPLTNPKQAYKDIRKHGPTLGAIAGTILGGPLGGTIGGGLGGLISSRKSGSGHIKPFSNAMRGLGHGAIIGGVGSLLGGAGMPPGFGGPVQGEGGFLGGLGNMGSGIGNTISGLMGGGGNAGAGMGGGLGGVLGSLGISPIQALLGAGTLYGMSKSKLKQPGPVGNVREQIPDFMRPEPAKERKRVKFVDRKYVPLPDDWNPETDPEHMFYQPYDEEELVREYAHGGHLSGETDGMADSIPARLSDGEYILDASTVSDLGSGNNNAGAKMLDDFVKRVRAHRRITGSKLPPKAKSLSAYGLKVARR